MGQPQPAYDFDTPPVKGFELSPYYVNRAAAYWREGLNTSQIADRIGIRECHIYNALDRIKPPTHTR